MLSLSYYHNCSRFASLKFAFSCNLYTFQNLSKNLWLFGLFLFAFYAKGELFLLIAFLRLMLFPFVLPLFAPAGTPARISCAAFAGSRAPWALPSDLHRAALLFRASFVLRFFRVPSPGLRIWETVAGSDHAHRRGTVGRWDGAGYPRKDSKIQSTFFAWVTLQKISEAGKSFFALPAPKIPRWVKRFFPKKEVCLCSPLF